MYGVLLPLFYFLLHPLKFVDTIRLRQVAVLLLIGLFAFNTFVRAGKWSNPFELMQSEVMHHPESARAQGEMGDIYAQIQSADVGSMENNYQTAQDHYEKAASLDENNTREIIAMIIVGASRNKPIEERWLSELTHRLESAALEANVGDQLIAIVTCQLKGKCKLPGNTLENLLNAPLRNPTLSGPNLAAAYTALSYYQINIASDYPAAIVSMHKGIEAAPQQLEYRLTLIKFLIALKRTDEAIMQIAELEQLDKMRMYASQIEQIRKTLSGPKGK
jgi:tetratricopeptide (TPR) repeat protein